MTSRFHKLSRSFYARSTLEVAADVVGKYIVYDSPDGKLVARIVEVEAYVGQDDPACHAAQGRTRRNEIMFGPPGYAYVYFIYGMYHCLNFVTEPENHAAALLLRAAEPVEGIDIMSRLSPGKKPIDLLSGPGKFCRSFGLTREQNGIDLCGDTLWLEDRHEPQPEIVRMSRIGIKEGQDRLWRFCDQNSPAVAHHS
ncbi:MAG: DNA-3-methyladenine glycosylase [candidate division Zixibacteria bacterium]|nr:DNA-3-methyladenine glycosylase [candidate division Zixibacteria bacterium]